MTLERDSRPCHSERREEVGAARFELTTSRTQTEHSTKLSYAPRKSVGKYTDAITLRQGRKSDPNK